MKVKVFIRKRKISLAPNSSLLEYDKKHLWCLRVEQRRIEEEFIPEEDRDLLNTVREIADKMGLEIRIINVDSLFGELLTKLNGINKYSALIIGNKKFVGKISKRDLESILKDMGE